LSFLTFLENFMKEYVQEILKGLFAATLLPTIVGLAFSIVVLVLFSFGVLSGGNMAVHYALYVGAFVSSAAVMMSLWSKPMFKTPVLELDEIHEDYSPMKKRIIRWANNGAYWRHVTKVALLQLYNHWYTKEFRLLYWLAGVWSYGLVQANVHSVYNDSTSASILLGSFTFLMMMNLLSVLKWATGWTRKNQPIV
jgi:hypothetical protein